MMATKIEWTRGDDGMPGEVWNPTTGCDRISAGCDHCYALKMAKRLKGMGQAKYQNDGDPRTSGPGFGLTIHPDALTVPLRWGKPRRVFVNSMSDLFHKDVPDAFIACVFTVMAKASQHTFQVLTKRHARMRSLLNSDEFHLMCFAAAASRGWDLEGAPWPLPNVWLGVSAEDQKWWDIRVPALMGTPAAVRFVSAEPLLGPIDPALDHECGDPPHYPCPPVPDWLIIGGESGPGARPMRLEWVRELLAQCRQPEVDTAPFVKQLGSVLGRELGAGSKGGNWDAWPEDLQIRQSPSDPKAVPA